MNKQNGNFLTDVLGFLILIVLALFLMGILFFPSSSISMERNQELKEMVTKIEKTNFESNFKNQIKAALVDGEISNREFNVLKDSYVSYESSMLIDSTGENNQSAEKAPTIENEESSKLNTYLLFFIISVLAMVVIFTGWKIVTHN